MSKVWRRISAAAFCAAVCAMTLGASAAWAAPLPKVPTTVTELYLPEEQEACAVGYGLYARLERAKLDGGAQVAVEAGTLSRDQTRIIAAWFTSARWGCSPPEEKLEGAGVARSRVALSGADGVVEFSLVSPQKKIRKSLTIACAPEKAEWVRDGLPLLPAWYFEPWEGGSRPPTPPRLGPPFAGEPNFDWVMLRGRYSVYAGLPADSLRKLHRSEVLEVRFADLPRASQQALVEAQHQMRFVARGFGVPESYSDPLWLQKRQYGITLVKFFYSRRAYNIGPSMTFPQPFRGVSVTHDGLTPPAGWWEAHGRGFDSPPPPSEWKAGTDEVKNGSGPGFLVAWPAEMQSKALAYARKQKEFEEAWMDKLPQGGAMARPGAPPPPKPPWTQDLE